MSLAGRTRFFRALGLVGAGFAALSAAALIVIGFEGRSADHGDRADDATMARGRGLYRDHCAACHGAELQGQPNWQVVGPTGKVLAPPHDATGHTWQHTDAELFQATKFGVSDVAPEGYVSDMPAFAATLSDDQIWDILAFMKSRWPDNIRAYQAMISNPTPATVAKLSGDWRFPPLCEEPSRALAAARQKASRSTSPTSTTK